jgi:hypothetical protein
MIFNIFHDVYVLKKNYAGVAAEIYNTYNDYLEERFILAKQYSEWERINSGYCTFYDEVNSADFGISDLAIKVLEIFRPVILEYSQQIGIDISNICIRAIWANIYYNGGSLKPHTHFYSDNYTNHGVLFYLKKPANSGSLYIGDTELQYEEGDIVIFPSSVEHWHSENMSDQPRILVGLDFFENLNYVDEFRPKLFDSEAKWQHFINTKRMVDK